MTYRDVTHLKMLLHKMSHQGLRSQTLHQIVLDVWTDKNGIWTYMLIDKGRTKPSVAVAVRLKKQKTMVVFGWHIPLGKDSIVSVLLRRRRSK